MMTPAQMKKMIRHSDSEPWKIDINITEYRFLLGASTLIISGKFLPRNRTSSFQLKISTILLSEMAKKMPRLNQEHPSLFCHCLGGIVFVLIPFFY